MWNKYARMVCGISTLKIGQSVTCNAAFNIVRVIIASLNTLSFFLIYKSFIGVFSPEYSVLLFR